eukprot:3917271-Lingulodinium_polyedra.AAC.1
MAGTHSWLRPRPWAGTPTRSRASRKRGPCTGGPPSRVAELAQRELMHTHPFTRAELTPLAREEGN